MSTDSMRHNMKLLAFEINTDAKLRCLLFYSETLEAERALVEERCEDRITNLQKHLKKFYSQELLVRVHDHLSQ